jgi:hypothetical protein
MALLAAENSTVKFNKEEGMTRSERKPKRVERLYGRLIHKKDLQAWDELQQRSEFATLGTAEILRQAIRNLANEHVLADQLNDYEKRMAASLKTLHRRLNQIENTQHITLSFLEVLMRTYYFHTVPVPKEAQGQAIADARRRIDKFLEDVAGTLQKGGAAQELALRLMDSDAGIDNG